MADDNVGRQTVVVVASPGGPLQLSVEESPQDVRDKIISANGYVRFRQPLGQPGNVFVRAKDVIAFWDQYVRITNDPRAFGMQQTPSGLHLPN